MRQGNEDPRDRAVTMGLDAGSIEKGWLVYDSLERPLGNVTDVEGGVLHVYPDVYDRETNTAERLREDLRAAGVDVSKLDDSALRQMIDKASASEKFVVRVSDIRRGRALTAGRTQPLVESAAEGKGKARGRG